MNHFLPKVIGLMATVVLMVACGRAESAEAEVERTILPPSKLRLEQICQSYVVGDYEKLISYSYNYKDKPARYQEQLVYMLKQHQADQTQKELLIAQMVPGQVVVHPLKTSANVYVNISYTNGQEEEVIFPMIYDKGNWWIK